MLLTDFTLRPIGFIRSSLQNRKDAPKQGEEGAPDALLEINPELVDALESITVGDKLIVISWFHQSNRETLQVHPRGDPENPLTGVFATRSPDRPNPLGLHHVTVLEISGSRLLIGPIETIDGTPIVDIKPVLN